MKKIIFLLLLFPFISKSQNNISVKEPYIEITGTAEKEVIPDEIYISIILKEKIDGRDKITIDKLEVQLFEMLKIIGVKNDQIVVSNLSTGLGKIKRKNKDIFIEKEYILKAKDATNLQRIFNGLDSLNVHRATIERVDYSKMEDLKKEVRINAVKTCKEKADYMLAVLNEKTGPIIYINETSMPYIEGIYENQFRGAIQANLAYNEQHDEQQFEELEFKKIKVQVTVNARFSIIR